MNLYIEVGKFNKHGEEKILVSFCQDGKTGESAHVENIKSKKQRLKIAAALLDLAYEIEAETAEKGHLGDGYAG